MAMTLVLMSTSIFALPVKPDQAVVNEIQTVLDSFKAKRDDSAKLLVKVKAIEEAIGLRNSQGVLQPVDSLGVVESAKRLLGLGAEKYEEYSRLARDYKLSQDELRTLSVRAISMASDTPSLSPSALFGALPAKYSCRLLRPSRSGSAFASGVDASVPKRISQLSGNPSPSVSARIGDVPATYSA